MSKPTLEEQIHAEVLAFASNYQLIPEAAKTIDQLRAEFPQIPHGRLERWLGQKVKNGDWYKERKGNVAYYWPAK